MNCDKLTGLDVLINDIFVEWSLPKNHDCWKTLVFISFLFSLVLAVTVSFNIFYLTAIYVISSFHDMKHYLSYIDKVKIYCSTNTKTDYEILKGFAADYIADCVMMCFVPETVKRHYMADVLHIFHQIAIFHEPSHNRERDIL